MHPGRGMTLRTRLAIGLMLLAALGLLVTGSVTYTLLERSLIERVDEQLFSAAPTIGDALSGDIRDDGNRRPRAGLPYGAYAQLTAPDGTVTRTDSTPPAVLPTNLTAEEPTTVVQPDGSSYRMLKTSKSPHGTIMLAFSLDAVGSTLRQMLLVELMVSASVLVGLGLLVWYAVGVGLRPLRRMEDTAAQIAAGDLSQRIEEPDPHTEVGRLGVALNVMLSRIEESVRARAASEQKMRRFLADASHELRTPLTSIRGYAELFRRGADRRPEDTATAMRRIEDESARMSRLVDDLLSLARLDEGRSDERAPVDLAVLAADACSDVRAIDHDRPITLDADTVVVLGDEHQLRQVVGNLIGNASRHTPAGTPIHVTVRPDGTRALLVVEDRGAGLPESDLVRVFDRFYRAEESRSRASGGTGLGLAIVAATMTAHQGRAWAENRADGGARFSIELPRVADSPVRGPLSADSQPNHSLA